MDKSAISAVSFLVLNLLFFTSEIAGLFISIVGSGYLVGLIFLAAKISYSLYPVVALFLVVITPILLFVAALAWGISLFIACGVIIRRILKKEKKKIERLYWFTVAAMGVFMCLGWTLWNVEQKFNDANPQKGSWVTEGPEFLIFPLLLIIIALFGTSKTKPSNRVARVISDPAGI